MATRQPIRVTTAGVLRAQFNDSAGNPIQASGVEVLLYEPGLTPGPDLPTVSGLIPDYLGNGIYQLEYTTQFPGGTWIDHWRGLVLGTLTTVNFSHSVLDSGMIVDYPTLGPCENNLIEVTLSSGIQSLAGVPLEEEHSFFFTTAYNPLYADSRKARLEAGGLLQGVSDYTLCNALLEASIEADCITFMKPAINAKLYNHARREYTACKAALSVAMNVAAAGGTLKNKRLADFSVEYDISLLGELIGQLMDSCKRWQSQVESGGGTRAVRNPRGVIKGELDPDRPTVGRDWEPVIDGDIPIGNAKRIPTGSRRSKTTYQNSRLSKSLRGRLHGSRRGKQWGDW